MNEQTQDKHTQEVELLEENLKWYLDPRLWLVVLGLCCWIVSSMITTSSESTLLP